MAKRTAIAYIDGHNFYHGVAKDSASIKWLDLAALCRLLLRDCTVLAVNYYTATVIDFPQDPTQSQRQNQYVRALEASGVNVIHGQFQKNEKTVHLVSGGKARATVYEEKGSDVNLGTDLSWDAAQARMQVALVVSNDFDLQRPILRAMAQGIDVTVLNPHHPRKRGAMAGVDGPLQKAKRRPAIKGTSTRRLTERHLRRCQLPEIVLGLDGSELFRPAVWR
jgi:hypothetical protein